MINFIREFLAARAEYKERLAALKNKPCESCETLRMALHQSQTQNNLLINELLTKQNPVEVSPSNEEDQLKKPIGITYKPWRVKQAELEAEDRQKAKILKEFAEEKKQAAKLNTDKLEKAIGVQDAAG